MEKNLKNYLEKHKIDYKEHQHKAVAVFDEVVNEMASQKSSAADDADPFIAD